jgi:hypothetical protein
MRAIVWLLVVVFVVGVIYPPAAAAITCGVSTVWVVGWLLATFNARNQGTDVPWQARGRDL